MGCDIHTFAERKIDGKWKTLDDFDEDGSINVDKEFMGDRNYTFFAFLAGVRDSDNITPLAADRGVPKDLNELAVGMFEHWGSDFHSASFVTLRELIEADWDQVIKMTRMVTKRDADHYKDNGWRPGGWCTSTGDSNYVELTWDQPIRELCTAQIAQIQRLLKAADCDIDNTRLVFAFDN